MKANRKYIASFLLVACIGLPGILFLVYKTKQAFIRHEMEEKLEKLHLQTIQIPVDEIVWYKKNKEIVVEGRLFDIKTLTIENGIATFRGLFDEKESDIKNLLSNLEKKQRGEKDKNLVAQFVMLLFYQDSNRELILQYPDCKKAGYALHEQQPWSGPSLNIPHPPPKA
jgi:hypothetical protein